MIYSKTSEYALRILVYFARKGEKKPMKIKQISAATAVPQAYTAKVLQFLARQKFLKSVPGPTGGFLLQADLSKLAVADVLAAVDNFPKCQFVDCVMGLNQCNDKNPCILHDAWMETKNKVMKILSSSTIQDLVSHPSSFRMGSSSKIILSKSMRNIFMKKILFIPILLSMFCAPAFAEAGLHIAKDPGKITTLKDVSLELPNDMGTFRFYGKERFRWNQWDYAQSAPFNNEYDYYSSQLRLGSRFENSLFKAHAAWQYTQLWNLPTGASAGAGAGAAYFSNGILEDESHGTYLKYLELSLKDIWHTGIVPSIGRFEYSSGYQYKGPMDTPEAKRLDWIKSKRIADRVIGGFEWSEYQRSFDGIKASWDTDAVNLNVAAISPTQGGFEEKAGAEIEEIRIIATELTLKKDKTFSGTELQLFHYHYEDMRLLTASAARPDNTGRTALAGTESDINLDMFGGHVAGAWALGDGMLDALFWGGWQTGEWFELNHDAYALAAEIGYQWNTLAWKPWLRGGYNLASGDHDATDSSHNTFYAMLPTARLYSSSILYNAMNLEDIFVTLSLKPCSVVTAKTDAHFLSLDESADRWYLGSGPMNRNKLTDYTARASSGNSNVGVLWDATLTWDIHPDVTATAYYGHLFGGDVVKSFYTNQKDVNFFSLELAVNF